VFLAIEQKEPHAGQLAFTEVQQPATYEERRALAIRCRDELEVTCTILIDGMDDVSRALFGDLPNPAFIVDGSGRIVAKLPWADPDQIGERLKALDSRPVEGSSIWVTIGQARARLTARDYKGAREEIASALSTPYMKGDPTPAVMAEAQLVLAAALRGESDAAAPRAATVAEAAARKAWGENPARLVAALCELASLEPAGPSAHARWVAALAALEARAPKSQRAWLEARVNATRP
jgi:hypothetical protein